MNFLILLVRVRSWYGYWNTRLCKVKRNRFTSEYARDTGIETIPATSYTFSSVVSEYARDTGIETLFTVLSTISIISQSTLVIRVLKLYLHSPSSIIQAGQSTLVIRVLKPIEDYCHFQFSPGQSTLAIRVLKPTCGLISAPDFESEYARDTGIETFGSLPTCAMIIGGQSMLAIRVSAQWFRHNRSKSVRQSTLAIRVLKR